MSKRLRQLAKALERVKSKQPPDERDQEILVPMLEDIIRNYDDGEIEFRLVGGKYEVDTTTFPNRLGFGFIHALLDKPRQHIACKDLDGLACDVAPVEIIDRDTLNDLVDEAKDIRRYLDNPLIHPDAKINNSNRLIEINLVLQQATHGGKPKKFNDELERCRQRVKHNIRRAILQMWTHPDDWNLETGPRREHPETSHIARHLVENIRTGNSCIYRGYWNWKTREKMLKFRPEITTGPEISHLND